MKDTLKLIIWPVVVGLLMAFSIMMLFELINSFFFPFPEGMDVRDVQAFTKTLPWTAYILVLLGWIVGSFIAGCVTTKLSRMESYKPALMVGIILTLLGVVNNIIIGHDMVFNIIGLPMFIIFTYLGHRCWLQTKRKSGVINFS